MKVPKRVLDGEGVWRSAKIARIKPAWIKAEYANVIPLALANGVFEAAVRLVWSKVYAFNRPEISVKQVQQILDEFSRVGLLFRWVDSEGIIWGFFTGIRKPGRLPPESRLKKGHEILGPEPPAEALKKYLENCMASHRLANGCQGLGLGSGSGLSPTGDSRQKANDSPSSLSESTKTASDPKLLVNIWEKFRGTLPAVREFSAERQRKCRARLNTHSANLDEFLKRFEESVVKGSQTPFLCGKNDRGWKATFDWFVRNELNHVRVLEGVYGAIGKNGQSGNLDGWEGLLHDDP